MRLRSGTRQVSATRRGGGLATAALALALALPATLGPGVPPAAAQDIAGPTDVGADRRAVTAGPPLPPAPDLTGDGFALQAVREDGFARLVFNWAGAPVTVSADLVNTVLVMRFSRPLPPDAIDAEDLTARLGDYIAFVRPDADRRTLRIALKYEFDLARSRQGNRIAIDLLSPVFRGPVPDVAPPPPPPPPPPAERLARRLAETGVRPVPRPAPAPLRPLTVTSLDVRVGQSPDFTRIVFDWPVAVEYSAARQGDAMTLVFDRAPEPDLTALRVDPPRLVTGARHEVLGGKLAVTVEMEEGATARHFRDGTRVILDLLAPRPDTAEQMAELARVAEEDEAAAPTREAAKAAEAEAAEAPGTNGADPAPPDEGDASGPLDFDAIWPMDSLPGIGFDALPTPDVVVTAAETEDGLVLRFPWPRPVGSAVFRRGGYLWAVFDADARIDLSAIGRRFRGIVDDAVQVTDDAASAVRLDLGRGILATVDRENDDWLLTLGEAVVAPPRPLSLDRERESIEGPGVVARIEGLTGTEWIADPEVGDEIGVALSLGPPQGLIAARRFVEFEALATAHGLAIVPYAEDVHLKTDEERVTVTRDGGLLLSSREVPVAGETADADPRRQPGFMDFDAWALGGSERFLQNQRALQNLAAGSDPAATLRARLQLARFYLAHDFVAEANGILRLIGQDSEAARNDPSFRALTGVTRALLGRHEEALQYLAARELENDPSAALWRGFALSALDRDAEARAAFERGRDALPLYGARSQARFRLAEARAALGLNDLAAAEDALKQVPMEDLPAALTMEASLVSARTLEAMGETETALDLYEDVAREGPAPLAVRAEFAGVTLKHRRGLLTDAATADRLESLRFRWRGDEVEIEILRKLGRIYVAEGDVRKGLAVMQSAVDYFPGTELSRTIQNEMAEIFEDLFLDGTADAIPPIQALGLYYEFRHLTPIGRKGDDMIRRLAERLVEVDLLEQAAELLQHQVDNRLRGVARAQVATRLAMVHLMNREPERALNTIRATRQARLPDMITRQRRLLEARALARLDRFDHALELIAGDEGTQTDLLRADIYWESEDWPAAAAAYEDLAAAERGSGDLSDQTRIHVMRAAVAYSLDGDEAGLGRLRATFGDAMSRSPDAQAFRVVTEDIDRQGIRFRELAGRIAAVDTLEAFMDEFRTSLNAGEGLGGEAMN